MFSSLDCLTASEKNPKQKYIFQLAFNIQLIICNNLNPDLQLKSFYDKINFFL